MANFHRKQAKWHQEGVAYWTEEMAWQRRYLGPSMWLIRCAALIAWHTRCRDTHRAALST